MSLPININELINGQTVETERIEFKEGWNPEAILHTICAFANDINNWGGGYIIIGIKSENGHPVLPPIGLESEQLDVYQKKLVELCHKIKPVYFPISEVTRFMGKDILILWVYGGQHRPYKVPVSLARKAEYAYYVRYFSCTKKASHAEERELMTLSNTIPFDDRINHSASLNDLNITLIQEYLAEIHSALAGESTKIPFPELCLTMNIAAGPVEHIKPKNIGLLLFNDSPIKFFPYTRIDIVEFEDEAGDAFSEKIFTGPIHHQVKEALRYLKNNVITEYVRKIPGKAEAQRFFNYPYEAFEEMIANAIYHRSYEEREPVEIRVLSDRIEVHSYPGPMPPLNKDNINAPVVANRRYRNQRLGDFLKELHLTEGRCTGFLKIRKALKNNGSPPPKFETDDDRSYFTSIIKIHPKANKKAQVEAQATPQATPQVTPQVRLTELETKIVNEILKDNKISRNKISRILKISSDTVKEYIEKLKKKGILKRIGETSSGYWEIVKSG
jgi:ATP-dependent DNA helicase RecG